MSVKCPLVYVAVQGQGGRGRDAAALHARTVRENYALSSWRQGYFAWSDEITFTNGSEYNLTNFVGTVTCRKGGTTYAITLNAPEIDPKQAYDWEGESDSDLHHIWEGGPTYTSLNFTCDQTK